MKSLIIFAMFAFGVFELIEVVDMIEGDISFRMFAGLVCLLFCALGGVAVILFDDLTGG